MCSLQCRKPVGHLCCKLYCFLFLEFLEIQRRNAACLCLLASLTFAVCSWIRATVHQACFPSLRNWDVYAYMPNFVSIGLFWWWKAQNFAVFWTSAFCGITTWQQSEKVEHGCTTTNLPLSSSMKVVSVLQCLHGKIGCTNSNVQQRDEQTDGQTDKQKNGTFLATLATGENWVSPNLSWW